MGHLTKGSQQNELGNHAFTILSKKFCEKLYYRITVSSLHILEWKDNGMVIYCK